MLRPSVNWRFGGGKSWFDLKFKGEPSPTVALDLFPVTYFSFLLKVQNSMTSQATSASSGNLLAQSRGWLIGGGLLSIFVGFMAMGSPYIFSMVIAQFLGIFVLISGVISLGLALLGKHKTHRLLEGVLGVVRIAAGVVLLACIASSLALITLIFAIFLAVEGVFMIAGSLQMRAHTGWFWGLINGVAALALGIMVYNRWPGDSAAVLGMFFGIFSLFSGMSRLMLGFALPKANA